MRGNRQVEISQDPVCNDHWVPVTNQEYRDTKETFDWMHADALHCRQLQNLRHGKLIRTEKDEVLEAENNRQNM